MPKLTTVFVILTGIFGATFGESMLYWMPLRSALARGSLFDIGAHAVGSNKAHQINRDEGAIAGLVMVLAGVVFVLAAPLLAIFCDEWARISGSTPVIIHDISHNIRFHRYITLHKQEIARICRGWLCN